MLYGQTLYAYTGRSYTGDEFDLIKDEEIF